MLRSKVLKITPRRIVSLAVIIILVVGVYSWWHWVYSSPTNVFDRMLANSLSSPSVAKTVVQSDDSQTLNQTSLLVTEPQQIIHSQSVLGQANDPSTSVITESVGTPETDFVRYTAIKTNQKNSDGNPFDFSAVLGIWGRTDQSDATGTGVQLFNQTVLGVVPTANIPQPLRKQLLSEIKNDNVYKIDTGSVKRQKVNGRPVYSYNVSLAPVAYVTMLKNFSHAIGLQQLDQVDPSQYQNSEPLKFTFDVDVWSGQLTKISYTTTNRTEIYSAYGARSQVDQPTQSIGVDELQTRLQSVH